MITSVDSSRSTSDSDTDSICSVANSDSSSTNSNILTSPPEPSIRYTSQKVDRRAPSTYHLKARNEQTFAERFLSNASLDETVYQLKSPSTDRGPMPRGDLLQDNIEYICKSFGGVILQSISYYLFPQLKWPILVSLLLYVSTFVGVMTHSIAKTNKRCVRLGTFDEKHVGRDRCPDDAANSLAFAYIMAPIVRVGFGFYYHGWNQDVMPWTQFSWTFPARAISFLTMLDLAFYTYHRACHEVPFLWKIHQKHHTTRHPSPVLGILADDWQEVIEIALVPLFAILLIPLSFHEYVVSMLYLMQVEIGGHSGVRIYGPNPILHAVLHPLNMEAILEDHDLHHRYGKGGKNYGKTSRIWDTIFGTKGERLECRDM